MSCCLLKCEGQLSLAFFVSKIRSVKAENIVLVGKTGVGKTGLSCGLLLKALENGYRCQFIRAQDLFDEMYASLADRSTRQLLKRLARLDVLLID